jgi:hypothetical protein
MHSGTDTTRHGTQIQNNGRAFTEEDWTRIRKIAEGNPNSDACGMFGVGFYSVFAMCEQPIIKSGTCNISPRVWWVVSFGLRSGWLTQLWRCFAWRR